MRIPHGASAASVSPRCGDGEKRSIVPPKPSRGRSVQAGGVFASVYEVIPTAMTLKSAQNTGPTGRHPGAETRRSENASEKA
jgi:hypothetical protein